MLKRKYYFFLFFSLLFWTSQIQAQSPEIQEPVRLTGNWNGLRTSLINNGIRFDAFYTGEVISNLQGGISSRSNYLDIMELMLSFNADKYAPWKGSAFYLNILGTHGTNPSEYIGDIQGVSNIAAHNTWKLYEIWLQQNLWKNKCSILLGIYDLNSEFDVLEAAGQFLHSSHGMGADFAQSGKNGPSTFPFTALALRMKTQLSEHVSIQSAILDGVPEKCDNAWGATCNINSRDGALITSEIIFSKEGTTYANHEPKRRYFSRQPRRSGKYRKFFRRLNQNKRRHKKIGRHQKQKYIELNTMQNQPYKKIAFGGWYYTSNFNGFENSINSENMLGYQGSWGIYLLFEKSIFLKAGNSEQRLSYFIRAGLSDKTINQIDTYLGSGMVYSGIIPQLQHDQIGLAVAAAHNSDRFKEAMLRKEHCLTENWEIAFELSYRAEMNDWSSIQPDVQYIINPGFNPQLKNATILGLRMEICF